MLWGVGWARLGYIRLAINALLFIALYWLKVGVGWDR